MTKPCRTPGFPAQPCRGRWLWVAVAILALGAIGGAETLAQQGASNWAAPVNLSRSGAASAPFIVTRPDGSVRVFWWDEFDGLMVADGSLQATTDWPTAMSAPIRLPETVVREGQDVVILTPIGRMPRIVGDASGRAYAVWLGEPDRETGNRPLLHSRLGASSTSWSSPSTVDGAAVSFDLTTDAAGDLHLVYVHAEPAQNLPVGLYYRRSRDGGASWSAPETIYQSRYMRLLSPEHDSLRVTALSATDLAATWSDPHQGQVLIARSTDGGATWSDPGPLLDSDAQPQQGKVIAVPDKPALQLWKPAGGSQELMAVSDAGNALMLSHWDGERWSANKRLTLPAQDPASGDQVLLNKLQVALTTASVEGEAEESLAVASLDQNGDVWITGSPVTALEQLYAAPSGTDQPETEPSAPANLSRSGAASGPAIVAGPDGALRAFWWDQFDGLVVAGGIVSASSVLSDTEAIVTFHDSWSDPWPVPLSSSATPQILSDAAGRVHAFWLRTPTALELAANEEVTQPLLYSRLSADGTNWSAPVVLAESALAYDVTADTSGSVHLAYLLAQETGVAPAGVYYRRTRADGAGWIAPASVYESPHLRLLSPGNAYLRLAADDTGSVYITWDDPRLEQPLLAFSPDGGATWQEPSPVGDPETQPKHARLVSVPGYDTLLLWENGASASTCSLLQVPIGAWLDDPAVAGPSSAGQPVLEALATCPEDERYLPLGEGQALMLAGSGGDALTLALWNSEQWSEPSRLSFAFDDPAQGQPVYLTNLQAALVRLPIAAAGADAAIPAADDLAGWALIAVGADGEGDVWATNSQMGDLKVVFAPPSPWSAPETVSESDLYPGLPAVAADAQGRLHPLWSEGPSAEEPGTALIYARWDGAQWTQPATVLRSPEGGAQEPALVAVGDRLHAVWSGGSSGEILYSTAFTDDAYSAAAWSEPAPLPAPGEFGTEPDIAAGPDGSLHVAYAVPLNEGRGIYYTHSADGGQTWSEARQVFDAAGAGWAMSDYPHLAVDLAGTIHVVWVRGDPLGNGLTLAIYYARSIDGGETWSGHLQVAEGAFAWPQVTASSTGQVHLVWNETAGEPAWWHQWSADGGLTWARPERVADFGNVSGPASLIADGSGTLHLVGLGYDDSDEPALLYTAWDGQRWAERELFRLDLARDEPIAGVSAAMLPAQGQLNVVFRAETRDTGEGVQTHLWHTGRSVPAVEVAPAPAFTPRPSPTPLPTSTPPILPTPTASFSSVAPATPGSSIAGMLPLLIPGGLAALLVVGVFGVGWLRARRR